MVDQVGEAHLNQPHNRRAGGGNQRPGQVGLAQLFPDGAGHHIRAPGHLKHLVKAHVLEPRQHLGDALQALELPVEGRRRQGDLVAEAADGGQRVGDGDLRVILAHADALAAVDAALVDNVRPAAAHADGLGGAALQAVGTGAALLLFQPHGMKGFLLVHGTTPLCSFAGQRRLSPAGQSPS